MFKKIIERGLFEPIKDKDYINRLFKNIARIEKIIISVVFYNTIYEGHLFFGDKKGSNFVFSLINVEEDILNENDKVTLVLYFKEIFYKFDLVIKSKYSGAYLAEFPEVIYSSFNRILSRHKFTNESALIKIGEDYCSLYDMNTEGLSFTTNNRFQTGQIVNNALLSLNNGVLINVDFEVKHFTKINKALRI